METFGSAETVCNQPTLSPGTIVGGYSLLRVIGAGGLGVVYEARHQRLDKRFAVKALRSELLSDPDARARFLREGRAAAKLRHPNVVDISDVTLDGGTPYLVMELLEGEDLASLIAREGSLSVQATIDLLVPVVSALTLAHECGIVHRDLKPKNVFLSRSALGTVIPKVVDFGVSKIVGESHGDLTTRSNACVGTPQYMSPEQARGDKHIDHRCDQFSLGVMAYECLTGWRTFAADSLFAVLSAVINRDPPSVHTINHAVSPELAAIVAKLMAKASENRFDSMHAVGQALLPFASSGINLAYGKEFYPETVSPALPEIPRAQPASSVSDSEIRLPSVGSPWWRLRPSASFTSAALAAALGLAWGVWPRSSVRGAMQSAPTRMRDRANSSAPTSPLPPIGEGAPTMQASFEVSTTDVFGSGILRDPGAGLEASSQSRLQLDRASSSRGKTSLGARTLGGPQPRGPSATDRVAHAKQVPEPATSEYTRNALPSANANHPERGVNGALILP